ncbi:BnaCnng28920D [Brassica napus]|uniref:BnaCnng28920D protein n=1 Tax=Brassica napus TaxID=3708 RepID=A0A078IVG6_BRANA|nr:BnaCnng28920D [Brassica napus]
MKFSISAPKQVQPILSFKNKPSIVNVNSFLHPHEKVVFVMGATGSGKSRLAIDLATRRASPLARGSGSRAHNMI